MDVDDVDEGVDVVTPFHDGQNGVEQHGSLVADDVTAKDSVIGRASGFAVGSSPWRNTIDGELPISAAVRFSFLCRA
jgi:hypothetical protein